jgi:hypothetical protein
MKIINHYIRITDIEHAGQRYQVRHNTMTGQNTCRITSIHRVTRLTAYVTHVASASCKASFKDADLTTLRKQITEHAAYTLRRIKQHDQHPQPQEYPI